MSVRLKEDIRSQASPASLPWGGQGTLLGLDEAAGLARTHGLPGCEIEATALSIGIFPVRYLRNMQSIGQTDQISLLRSRVAQVGLGGLGGSLLEQLLRLGVGRIRAADGDAFEASNLNRQALSKISNMGQPKARAAGLRAAKINPSVVLDTVCDTLTPDTLSGFLAGCDLAVDALGGLTMRRHLQVAAERAGIPLVTGALAGWTGYVSVVLPGRTGPADIMGTDNAAEETLGCPAPTASFFASLMAAETCNALTGSPTLAGKMLVADLRSHTFEIVSL